MKWKPIVKWIAGKAFTWGLKKLTELSPEDVQPAKAPAPRKPRSRKPYAH